MLASQGAVMSDTYRWFKKTVTTMLSQYKVHTEAVGHSNWHLDSVHCMGDGKFPG